MLKSRKGLLLTLVTIVLFLLMLSELITYVTFSINYDSLSAVTSSTFSSSSFATTLNAQSVAWLRSSLYNALGALTKYESTPAQRNGNFINSTALALKSLIMNGTVYGTNLNSTMGGSTLKVWLNSTRLAGLAQNVNVSIKNTSITVFQGGPFSLNVTLTGLVVINSTYGVSTYPLSVTTGIPLNGTVSLYSAETADTSPIKAQASYPIAQLVGNTYAQYGSTSPFMFAYGTIVYEGGTPSCSAIPSGEQNKNFILATPSAINIPQNACGMAGVITYTANTAGPQTPYLIYTATTNVLKVIQNGTSLLLDGKGLALYNLSQIQNAVQNGYAYSSGYAPSFLDQAQGTLANRNPNGVFSFTYENRQSAAFIGSNYISTGNTGFPLGNSNKAVFAWIYPTTEASQQMIESFGSGSGQALASLILTAGGHIEFTTFSSYDVQSTFTPPLNTWSFVGYTYNGITRSTTIYFNGQTYTGTLGGNLAVDTGQAYIGRYSGGQYWNGKIADVQVYNGTVNPAQAYQLYQEGIGGTPIVKANLTGWWPLNGNGNDYSGRGNNATAVNAVWSSLSNYNGNPLLQGSVYNSSSNNKIAGALNCGTLTKCANSSLQHLYLGAQALTGRLSLQTGYFTGGSGIGNGYISVPYTSSLNLANSFSVSDWVNITSLSAGTIFSTGSCFGQMAQFFGNGGFMKLRVTKSSTNYDLATTAVIPANKWLNFVVAYNSVAGTEYIYQNGMLNNSAAAVSGPLDSQSWGERLGYVGCGPYTTLGRIANVQVYNSVLTQQQINSIYASGLAGTPKGPAGNVVAWWPLNGSSRDYSGNGKNGASQNNVGYLTAYTNQTNGTTTQPQAFHLGDAVVPNVANFDGVTTDNIIITQDTGWPSGSSAVSFFAWVRSTQSAVYPVIFKYGQPGVNYQWGFGDYNGQPCADDGPSTVCGTSISDGKWHFVGITYAAGGIAVTVYVDGIPTAGNFCAGCVQGVVTGAASVAKIATTGGNSQYFNGSIADLQVYNVTLTQAQVNQLYTNDSVLGVSPVASFPLGMGVNSLLNETPNLAFPNNYGVLGSCTTSNVINGQCGIKIVQP